jgi:hypothetical protein
MEQLADDPPEMLALTYQWYFSGGLSSPPTFSTWSYYYDARASFE